VSSNERERAVEEAETAITLDAAATLALIVFGGVVAAGLVRMYGSWDFLPEALVIVVAGHGVSFAARRLGVPTIIVVALTAVVVTTLAVRTVHPETFRAVFPTGATWTAVRLDIDFIGQEFAGAVSPVPYEGGWALLGLVPLAVVVWLGDAFAFAARGRGETLVPGAVLFIFVAALGTDRLGVRLTLALLAAGLLVVALLRANYANVPKTSLGPARHPLSIVVPAAAVAAAVVVLGAWTIGPRLPGADDEPWVDTRGRGGGGVTEVVSPLVDIRSRLLDQSALEMATVTATAEANWRVSTLADFDGNTWGLPQRPLEGVGGELNEARPGSVPNVQTVTIGALGGRLVPAAADPVRVSGEGLRFNADSSTLVRTDRQLAAGDVFQIESAMPVFDPDALRATSAAEPPDPIYLELPGDFPDSVRALAMEATGSAGNAYDRARTLQDWFRTNFRYDVEQVSAGHSISAIEAFLERRSGYCEQFAGTFAAMARSLGLPARVAVGFTPGVVLDDGAYHVYGRQAHTWPEVWFDGYGWVAFEPTPGRGAPNSQQHTGVAPEQDATAPAPVALPVDVPATTTVLSPVNLPDDPSVAGVGTPDTVPPPTSDEGGGGLWTWIVLVVAAVAAALAAPAVGRRLRRRQTASDPDEHVAELWARARRAVEATTGTRLDPARTPLEQARDVAPRLPVAAQPMRALAEVATAAAYGPPGALADAGLDAFDAASGPDHWCHEIESVAADAMTPTTRVRQYFTTWN